VNRCFQIGSSITLDVEAEVIAGGVVEVLADAQVPFRSQNRGVAQRQLDLFQGGAAFVASLANLRRKSCGAA